MIPWAIPLIPAESARPAQSRFILIVHMRARLEEHDDDGMSEILRRAVQKDALKGGSKLDQLLAAANEMGISPEAVKEAELEYRAEEAKRQELNTYSAVARIGFRVHFGTYIIVNAFLVGINLMTWGEDHEIWFPYCLLGWGIGVAIHAMVAFKKPDWNDPEFQKWRRAQASGESAPPS